MGDSETKHIVELQTLLAQKLADLGFGEDAHSRELVHHLSEIAARSRTFEQQSLPLFLALSPEHRRSFAQLLMEIKADLDAMQDSITDAQPALQALLDHLIREDQASETSG
jgi:hypothetical protein